MILNTSPIWATFLFVTMVMINWKIVSSFPLQIGFDIDGEAANDGYWSAVALNSDGSSVAIGAYNNDGNGGTLTDSGHARVFELSGNSWIQKGGDIDGVASGDRAGMALDMSDDGTIVAVGSREHDGPNGVDSGHVRIFEWSGSAWVQKGSELVGEAAGDRLGATVGLSADGLIVAAGASFNDDNGENSGHARVFQWDGSDWAQMGSDIGGEAAGDQFGGAKLALSDNGLTLAVGAAGSDGNGVNSGHVRVFEWNGSAWLQKGSDIDGAAAGDQFGSSISMSSDGSIFAASAPLSDANGESSGEVRVFEWSGSAWVQMGVGIAGEAAGEHIGAVALSGDGMILAVGGLRNDGNGADSGHVRVYQWNGSAWIQVLTDIDGEAAGDQFGSRLALSQDGLILAVHGPYNDGANGVDSSHVRVYRLGPELPPSSQPTNQPTIRPSDAPTSQPTNKPSDTPTSQPTNQPTNKPSDTPTSQPTDKPSETPTSQPTNQPTKKPSDTPTSQPSNRPTNKPSDTPTSQPTNIPSDTPTSQPTNQPTNKPLDTPTSHPTNKPVDTPTSQPTNQPTNKPSDTLTSQQASEPGECRNSYRVLHALCADYSADDIIRHEDAGYCRVKVNETWTCVPLEVTTCNNR